MNPYVIGVVALVIVVMGWQLKSSITRNGELKAKLDTQVTETLECVDANKTNLTTVRTLESRISVMVEERRVDTARREKVLDERDQELSAAKAEAQRLQDERDDAFDETPDCTDLAGLRVDFFCPAVSSELRQRSRSQSSN